MTDSNAKPLGSALVTLAALVIVLAGMRAAAEIVVPFLLVLFIAILCALAVEWLTAKGLGRGTAVGVVLGVLPWCTAVRGVLGLALGSRGNVAFGAVDDGSQVGARSARRNSLGGSIARRGSSTQAVT